jgi:phosphate/sulfate permease
MVLNAAKSLRGVHPRIAGMNDVRAAQRTPVVWQIVIAWVLTLPATIALADALFWLFSRA